MNNSERTLGSKGSEVRTEVWKKGAAAAPGIAIGRAYLVDRRRLKTPKRRLQRDEVDDEISRFRQSLQASDRQLERIKQKIEAREESEHYNIIAAHQLILHDEHLVDETIRYIREEQINAEWALQKTLEHIRGVFDAIEDDYFRERRSDVDFVGERVLRNLLGRQVAPVNPPPDAIIVAHDLSPADTAQLHRAAVAGLVTDAGGKTSHTAIIARAHQIPAVVGLEDIMAEVGTDDLIVVDGTNGMVVVNPGPQVVAQYRDQARKEAAIGAALRSNRDLPAQTQDGTTVDLVANVDYPDEVPGALDYGARGVGLFRTEYLFLAQETTPDEELHFTVAKSVLEAMSGRVVTFRTFDLGADKLTDLVGDYSEMNPALGLRSIRLCLTDRALPAFKQQLRGILRASVYGKARIMFPLISGLSELRAAMEVLNEAKEELLAQSIAFDHDLPIGIMIEMPSAAIVADLLAKEVDFFSIGTNDLIQYTLAVDRVNEHVTYLYQPLHPSLLRLIDTVVRAAKTAGIQVAVCGEMAGDPHIAPILVGLGLRELSMNSVAIPEVKSVIRSTNAADLEQLAGRALSMTTGEQIAAEVEKFCASISIENSGHNNL